MTPETFIKAELAGLAYNEAAHCGGVNNMLAVMFVFRNRQRAGWHGGDWMSIMAHHAGTAGTFYPRKPVNVRDLAFRQVLQAVDDIYSGAMADRMTEGALYYAELNKIEIDWFRENILRRPNEHPRIAQVGNVYFFT